MEMELGKLFIGGISWDTNEDRLREYFQAFGEVVEAVIMKDRATGRARGFGFVVFADPAVAERVVMEKHLIDGRNVEAKKAVPREDQNVLNRTNSSGHGSPGHGPTHAKKIFVGGLASTVTESDFKKYFEQFGTITDVVVMYDHNTQRPRGFGFITYDSEEAVDKVLYKTFHELNGKMVEVKRAVPKDLSSGPTRSPVGKVGNILNGYAQGYDPTSFGGFGIRMDGRFSAMPVGRNNFSPIGPGYGMTLNYEQGLSPSYIGYSDLSSSLGYGRSSPSPYGGNSGRYGTPIGYAGGNIGNSFALNSMRRDLWGNDSISDAANSVNSSAFTGTSGSISRLSSFGSIGAPLVTSASQGGRADPFRSSGSFGNGDRDFSVGLGERGLGQNNWRNVSPISSQTPTNVSYDGSQASIFEIDPFLGDSAWKSPPLEVENAGSLGYALGSGSSDVLGTGSAAYVGGYNFTDRQTNTGIAA